MQLACNQTRDPSTSLMDPESSKQLPRPLKKFYKGEPLALGITQLLLGITQITFGLMLHMSYEDIFHFSYFIFMMPYWTGMPFLVSGLLSVAAARRPNPSLVKSILGMNVVSAVAASLGMIFLSLSLAFARYNRHSCSLHGSIEVNPRCYKINLIPFNIVVGILGVFLIFNFLEFCISLSSAAFGCKTLCRDTFTEKVVVVYQSAPPDQAYFPVVHQDLFLDNTVSRPASSKNAENLLSCSPSSLPSLAPASEVPGLDKGKLHQPEPVEQASSGDVEF